jgi:cell division transport system permease protein
MRSYAKRAILDIIQNRFLNVVTVVTIALSILIVSAFALFFYNTRNFMNTWKEGVRIMVYLKKGTPPAEIPALEDTIKAMYGVHSVRFLGKDEALAQLKTQMKNQASLLDDLKENPLPDAFDVRVNVTAKTGERIERLAAKLETLPHAAEVEYGQRWLGRFTNIFNLFTIAGYALGALFFMAAVFFVANTIRLVLYSRRDEVEIMRLVGAEDGFIKTPFYIQGIIQGAMGGALGIAALFVVFWYISANVTPDISGGLFQVRFLPPAAVLVVILAAMLVGWLGCFVSLKQFLRP